MKSPLYIIVPIIALALTAILFSEPIKSAFTGGVGGGTGTLNQLSPFTVGSGQVRLSSSTADFRIPSLASLDCLGTDGNGVLGEGTCSGGGGGGGGLFVYSSGQDTLTPFVASTSNTVRLVISRYTATSTTLASTFPLASTTGISGTNLNFTNARITNLLSTAASGSVLVADGTQFKARATSTLGISGGGSGTVTSVNASVPTGWTISGNPITTSGTLAFDYDTGYGPVLTASSSDWNTAFLQSHAAVTLAGEDFFSLSTQQITANAINPDNLASADFGDFTCNGTNCSLDADTVGTSELDLTISPTWTGLHTFASTTFTGPITFDDGTVSTSTIYSNFGNMQFGSTTKETFNIDFRSSDLLTLNSYTGVSTFNFDGMSLQENGIAVLSNDDIDASSELLAIMDDETGSGNLVFNTSPQFAGVLTFVGASGTEATSTRLHANSAFSGAGLTDCDAADNAVTWNITTKLFGCNTIVGSGGGGGALSTTTDTIGNGGEQLVSYITGDVGFGGTASTSMEFQFDDDGGIFILASTTDTAATGTIEADGVDALRFASQDKAEILELLFGTNAVTWQSPTGINSVVWPTGTTLTIPALTTGGDTINEFAGTGLTVSGNALTSTLGTAITSSEITDNEIVEADLNINSPTDLYLMVASSTASGGWEWMSTSSALLNLAQAVSGGGGGTGGGTGTTTGLIGDSVLGEEFTFVNQDFCAGGNSSTTCNFMVDEEGGIIIASSTDSAATGTIASDGGVDALRVTGDSGAEGIELDFGTVGDWIVRGIGSVVDFVLNLNLHIATGKNILLGSTQWNNGDNIEVDAIAGDTTDNDVLDLAAGGTGSTTVKVWSVTVASTSPAFISGGLLAIPMEFQAYTMARIVCKTDTGTSVSINIEDASANATEAIVCDGDGATDDGSITNAGVTALEEMYINFGTVTGAVDSVSITVYK